MCHQSCINNQHFLCTSGIELYGNISLLFFTRLCSFVSADFFFYPITYSSKVFKKKIFKHLSFCFTAVDFFNQINMLYGTITEFCTEESCPVMSAGPKYEYHWADGQTVKKPIKCSAPKYIDYLMSWVQDQLDDENLFPSKIGQLHIEA